MNWNPYKRIADLERRVERMHHEMLAVTADYSMRINMLERTKAKEAAAGFVNPAFESTVKPAGVRRSYAKRKAEKAAQS
jgi:hypothetical protein